jgi:hypothetical protein
VEAVVARLKRCPLCGALNGRANDRCFVCTWSGRFETDAETLHEGLLELMERCPEVAQALFRENDRRLRFGMALRAWWRALRGFDMRV